MLKQKETDRGTSIACYLLHHPREQWLKTEADDCVFGIKAERSEGKVKERKRKKLMEVEKGERSGESSVVPMVQRMSCLCSHGLMCVCVCVCVSLESLRALEPKGAHRDTYYPPETWHTTRERDRKERSGVAPTFHLSFPPFESLCLHMCVSVTVSAFTSVCCVC